MDYIQEIEPVAYGILNLTPDQLGRMTPGEFGTKLRGFNDYQNKLHQREEELMIWQAWIGGYVAACGFGGKLPDLGELIADHRRARNREPEAVMDEDEALIKLAQVKDLSIPTDKTV